MTYLEKRQERPKQLIDFDVAPLGLIKNLAKKWEREARAYEVNLDRVLNNPKESVGKKKKMFQTAHTRWKRIEKVNRAIRKRES